MKKLVYIVLFAITSSMVVSACTEEEVVPTQNGGGIGTDPKKKA